MNNLQIFNNEQFGEIRMIEERGKLFFCGSDIAKALGYARPNEAAAAHSKGTVKRRTPTKGGEQEMLFISEGDVYRLITNSKLPSAEQFECWVFDEVLPSIRKHGIYATDNVVDQILTDPDFGIKLLSELKAEREEKRKLETENHLKDQLIGELKPKADYTDIILRNKGLVTITQISKDYGMSGEAMNKLLRNLGIQYKQSGQWLLYAKWHDKGYTHSETVNITHSDGRPDVKMNTKWTQKGRLFLYELLKNEGVYPLVEQDMTA